jgi:hypothetical protein
MNGMGKGLSATGVVPRRERFDVMRRLPVLAVLVCLAVAACTPRPGGDDDDHRTGGFYGGVSGGMSRP